MSESVLPGQLERIEDKISSINARLDEIGKEKRQLEADRQALSDMARIARERVAILREEQSAKPIFCASEKGRVAGMRESSRKRRIWNELENMLMRRNGAIQRNEIMDHMSEIGLIDDDRKQSVANLLSEYRKAGLVDTDGHGYWFLPAYMAGLYVREEVEDD